MELNFPWDNFTEILDVFVCVVGKTVVISIKSIIIAIKKETDTSSSGYGYKMMRQKLRQMVATTNRETFRLILKALDPDGVMNRSRYRLRRNICISKGSNYVWHIDGYDKHQPCAFLLRGCIGGYSQKVLWLQMYLSDTFQA